jgi:hypothetical protein
MLIGTSTIRVENNQLIGVVRFESAEINPIAERFGKATSRNTSMASIGANPRAGRWGEEEQVVKIDNLFLRSGTIRVVCGNSRV